MIDTTISRRSALRTGTLAAIAAGLLGTTATAPVSASPLPPAANLSPTPVLGTVTNMADLVAEIQQQIERVRAHDHAAADAETALCAALNAEQRRLFFAYQEADTGRDFEQMDLYIMDLGRHLPGLHPAIWALSRHMFESRQGECCLPGGA